MNDEITLKILNFFGASEASVDCFQRLERSQNSPSLKGWRNFQRKFRRGSLEE